MAIAAITTTSAGLRLFAQLGTALSADIWIPTKLSDEADRLSLQVHTYPNSLKTQLAELWSTQDQLIFCLATGAVVRLIAPLLTHKGADPAVVVLDEAGKFAISLCGGHQAGADRLTSALALLLDAQPVLTGAANYRGLPGIDTLGTPFGWTKGEGDWTGVSAAVAAGQPVQFIQDSGSGLWQQHLPNGHPFQFGFPEFADRDRVPKPQARVWISAIQRSFGENTDLPKVQWHPRVLWVGIGCERGTAQALIAQAVDQALKASHLAAGAIAGVATLDLKADEPGLVAFCQSRGYPLRTFAPEVLRDIAVPNPSAVVERAVGTPSVAEAGAIAAASRCAVEGQSDARDSLGFTSVQPNLRFQKRVYRHAGCAGAVTVAIAQAEREYTGRTGELLLVGTGPGSLDQMTAAAKAAISRADAVVGYGLYVDLIQPVLRPGQLVEALPITQEKQRAEWAIALANWGLTVAVVSSGDCGIYGMAGLVLETLKAQGWDGRTPTVQVLPGISALQSAAARAGAPLMHDFCAISLSDLLTPWEVIQKRLIAAAQADFVVALYNPKSKTRTEQIRFAQGTFLQCREPETPVVLARSLYRPDEQITLTTLADLLTHPIDMLTTVLIGNQSSLVHANWFITPRGYLGRETNYKPTNDDSIPAPSVS